MTRQVPAYTAKAMTKEQFFYAYKQLAMKMTNIFSLKVDAEETYASQELIRLLNCDALDGDNLQIIWRDGTEEVKQGDPLELLTDFVESYKVDFIPELPEFQGGVAGFISYDYVRRYE